MSGAAIPVGRYATSQRWHERAIRVLAGGVSSEFRRFGSPHPLHYTHAAGATITDADGNVYLDFALSQGPMVLGHSHPEVLAAVAEASARGVLYAGQHQAEIELAETLQRLIPGAELLRFSLSGSEAMHAAWRCARALTGRTRILRFEGQYHGWLDPVAPGALGASEEAMGPRSAPLPISPTAGLPPRVAEEIVLLPWNDLALVEAALERHGREIAAIVTEPVMCNVGCIEPQPGFLEGLRRLCDRHGIVLIFDEVITGFRLHLGGAQAHYGVTPDLAVFGKALASGYPISVLAGTRAAMEPIASGRVIHAGTMNSSVPTVAAALATLRILERDRVPERLHRLGRRLMEGLRTVAAQAQAPLRVQGPGPMFHVGFTTRSAVTDARACLAYDRDRYARFVAAMQDRGVRLIGRGLWYVSASHTEADLERCLQAARAVVGA